MLNDTKITSAQFKKLSALVYKESGIKLNESKIDLLKARISKRLRLLKMDSIANYIQLINDDQAEFLSFIDAVTTNHTFFFRENKHCEYILANTQNSTPLKIWSAACSSGEEPYTIAVQLMNMGYKFSIDATDISDSMLSFAQRGIYPKERARVMPVQILHKYFQKGKNKWEGHIKVKKEVARHILFDKFNLITESSRNVYDIIFCRNVMIYFDDITKEKVVKMLYSSLRPGGLLMTGMSESLMGLNHGYANVATSIYRR